jgi:1-deoxy-D-xylulose-5-phosphate reductoisomerase
VTVRRIAILGATGSIGRSTLDVVDRYPGRFRVEALTAHSNIEQLLSLCERYSPAMACIADPSLGAAFARAARQRCPGMQALAGADGLVACAAAASVDGVMAAIVGAAGLPATLAAAAAGKTVYLANKEALVMSGAILMDMVKKSAAALLPIDSEHNAIFQCLPTVPGTLADKGVRRLILTASGGPFRQRRRAELAAVTPDEACAHPNWVMGRKISVDSATMMNKGLEIIEAHWLFGATREQVDVLIHPQSVIHSMVEYADGSVIAQLGNPDMRTPIAHALAYPERVDSGVKQLSLAAVGSLTFEEPDLRRFPALALAYGALAAGGTAPIALNAANEVAVDAFLKGGLSFLAITDVIDGVLSRDPAEPVEGLDHVLEADARARASARQLLEQTERSRACI